MLDLVMLVDDNDTDNFISKRIIELAEFAERVEVKRSGKSALEYLAEHANNPANIPSLIFLDINMPIVNGFVFLYEYEQLSSVIHEKCQIAVLSSSDTKRDIDRMLDNKFVIKFITKPLSEESLAELQKKII